MFLKYKINVIFVKNKSLVTLHSIRRKKSKVVFNNKENGNQKVNCEIKI